MDIPQLRRRYHQQICAQLLGLRGGVLNNADRASKTSTNLAQRLARNIGQPLHSGPPSEQTAGKIFTDLTEDFLEEAFELLRHIAPREWQFSTKQGRVGIAAYDQYEHLTALQEAIKSLSKNQPKLAAALGGDYLIAPDIVVGKSPVSDETINSRDVLLPSAPEVARLTPFRKANTTQMTLHAIVSCKWTIRSDRAQNVRTEALNLIRLRKGGTPHIVAVIAEPMPTRIASLALGTGDIDCVYHMALPELRAATRDSRNADQEEMLNTLVTGRRLRDIADLPFDLVN